MYSTVCPKCGEKSEQEVQYCTACGSEKSELATKGSIFKDINNVIVEKLNFLDYPQLYVTIIYRLILLLISIYVIPDFITNSEFFWMVIGIFSVYGLVKEIAKSYNHFLVVYKISRALLFAYFGAGIGNLIAHAGTMSYYRFSYYFNLNFLLSQLFIGNSMIIVGAIAGIGVMMLYSNFRNDLEAEE